MLAIFQQLGLGEILIILAVLLLMFGARKLPELARSMGRSTKEFKAGLREGATDPSEPVTADDTKTPEQTKTPE
jgi:sec-independent protein translocase protein TatA